MKALITSPVCPLFLCPDPQSPRADEALLGMVVEVLGEVSGGCVWVETAYGYRGYAPADRLLLEDGRARDWEAAPKSAVLRGVCDCLTEPDIRAPVLLSPVRGCVLLPLGAPDEKGWQSAALPDGRGCYIRRGFLGPFYTSPSRPGEEALRAAVTRTALSYFGAPYRWGGKSPLGLDCSGLTFMAYYLNGVTIWRDAQMKPGYPVREIALREVRPADLLYFPGHVALYLGEGRYLHATARDGSDGVVINSLDPRAPDYRPDLAERMIAVGSIF